MHNIIVYIYTVFALRVYSTWDMEHVYIAPIMYYKCSISTMQRGISVS